MSRFLLAAWIFGTAILALPIELSAQPASPNNTATVTSRPYPQAWSDILSDLEKVVRTIAVLIASVWGYFKFVKGRVFSPRLEIELSGYSNVTSDGRVAVVLVTLKNIGLSRVNLTREGTALSISGPKNARAIPIEWNTVAVLEMFHEHQWIEPSEVIRQSHVVAIETAKCILRCDARLVAQKKEWNASCVVASQSNKEE